MAIVARKKLKRNKENKNDRANTRTCRKANESTNTLHGPIVGMSELADMALIGKLKMLGAPALFLHIVYVVSLMPGVPDSIDVLESFSGDEAVTRSFQQGGYRAIGFEVLKNPLMKMLSAPGYVLFLKLLLQIRGGGFKLAAPVCSSWVWINRGTSRRSWSNPLGDTRQATIAQASCMVARVILGLLICEAKSIWWVLEQPQGSLMRRHPAFCWLVDHFK
eukprot:8437568-Alexandrium_andersonii.AAC.1